MKKIRIGNKEIGKGRPVFIIAEIGSNHNQDLQTCRSLIDASLAAGVDAVKFQSFKVERWISKDFKSFPTLSRKASVYEQLKRCELPYELFKKAKRYAQSKGLICFSSPSNMEDVDELHRIGVAAFKFGSVQITDLPTLSYAASKKKPILLSVGGATLEEIKEAIDSVYKEGNKRLILLHCSVLYPAGMDQVNLSAMPALEDRFNTPIGYSDHTMDPVIAPVAAVALGACVIEKHITLNRRSHGPDHFFALEPDELKTMVAAIREAEKVLGALDKRYLAEERKNVKLGRRSVAAVVDISPGEKISKDMLALKRPGFGIPPKMLNKIIGKRAKIHINKDSVIKKYMIERF